jgi:hypothetical protein
LNLVEYLNSIKIYFELYRQFWEIYSRKIKELKKIIWFTISNKFFNEFFKRESTSIMKRRWYMSNWTIQLIFLENIFVWLYVDLKDDWCINNISISFFIDFSCMKYHYGNNSTTTVFVLWKFFFEINILNLDNSH